MNIQTDPTRIQADRRERKSTQGFPADPEKPIRSTVLHADTIVVLEKGRIVECGSHADLVEGSGLYSRLHALQFSDQPVKGDAASA